jgi:molybdopterin synthase catalytic subunit
MNMNRKTDIRFFEGPVPAEALTAIYQELGRFANTGAYGLFLGQVRADEKEGGRVEAIHYTAYEEMALEKAREIENDIFAQYPLSALYIYHSLGEVKTGGVSILVAAASAHRRAALDACSETVERLKKELPVWGKERMDNSRETWKENN